MDITRQIQDALKKIDEESVKRDQQLEKEIKKLIRNQGLSDQISVLQQQKEILAHVYDKASAYTNIVMTVGYAAVFGIWQLMKDHLTYGQNLLVAVLVIISIMLFAGFEVYKMISHAFFFRRLNKILTNFPGNEQGEAWKIAWNEYSTNESRIWVYFLIPTVLSGFGVGFLLLLLFIRQVSSGI